MYFQSIKKMIVWCVLSFFIMTTVTPLPQYINLIKLNHKFHNNFKPTYSKHTTAYNVENDYTEKIYLKVRKLVGVTYVNDKVRIINVAKKLPDGSIGTIGKDEISGLYISNIIYYDGTEITLEHELAHFFYEKMKETEQSEMFAQSIERFYLLLGVLSRRL